MNEQTRILLVDDEASLREPLAEYLGKQGFAVTEAPDAARARTLLRDALFDIVLLDIMMPGEDGLSLCRHVQHERDIPVIFITARGEETERIVGLELGADDYVTKPFSPRELVARIKTVLRRLAKSGERLDENSTTIEFSGWTLALDQRRLSDPDGVQVPISGGEFELLHALLTNAGKVLSRDRLLDLTRGREAGPFDRSVDNQVSRLRRKIEADPKNPDIVKTVWGGGYVLAGEVVRR